MPLTLLLTGDFGRQDAVAESFMRSSVVFEHNRPLRFSKHLGSLYPVIRPKVSVVKLAHHVVKAARCKVDDTSFPKMCVAAARFDIAVPLRACRRSLLKKCDKKGVS